MDHYSTLGVDKNAGPDDIKRAYRKMASQHHPDKGGDTAKFQQIEEAYRILSDPEKREQYNNPRSHMGGMHHGSFNEMPGNFEEMFGHMFGGGHPFGDIFGRRGQPVRNRTLNLQTQITLEDAYHGRDLLTTIQLPSGRDQVLEVKIPPGVYDGITLRLAGMGDDSIGNMPRGDIHLSVQVLPHAVYQRQGDDLIRPLNVDCLDAILGKTLQFETLDHRTLEINIAPGTQHGQMLAVQGYGMPNIQNSNMRGRLLLNINITVPTNLTDEQKLLIKQIVC